MKPGFKKCVSYWFNYKFVLLSSLPELNRRRDSKYHLRVKNPSMGTSCTVWRLFVILPKAPPCLTCRAQGVMDVKVYVAPGWQSGWLAQRLVSQRCRFLTDHERVTVPKTSRSKRSTCLCYMSSMYARGSPKPYEQDTVEYCIHSEWLHP